MTPGPPTLLVVAGEASGDMHAASLLRELKRRVPELGCRGIGGDLLQQAGAQLLYHYGTLAVVGITEVLAHLGDVRRAMSKLEAAARAPDVVGAVLVDYADFNMQLARRLRRARPELPIVYYVSPQVWAWRRGRIQTMARLVDRMLVILPFEEALYRDAGVDARYVGHPLLDALSPAGNRDDFAARHGLDPEREWVALLPGSRRMEVAALLGPMIEAARILHSQRSCAFPIARAPSLPDSAFEPVHRAVAEDASLPLRLINGDTHELLRHSRGAMVCSGTATLEAGVAGTPEVVVYKTSWLTYNLAKLLVRIDNIALVNVIGGKRGVPELLQQNVTPQAIAQELVPLLQEGQARRECLEFLAGVRRNLGDPGASARAAQAILEVLHRRGTLPGLSDPAGAR